MKRIVGLSSKAKAATSTTSNKPPPPPKPGIKDVVESTDRKVSVIDSQVAQCENELRMINQKMKKLPPGCSRQTLLNKARNIVARKKRYEQQADSLRDKSLNLDTLACSISIAEDMKIVANEMESGTKALKKQLKKVDLDKIEDFQDELTDLIDLTEDVQAAMSKSYGVPEDIDDEELNAQLELLGDEIVQDNDPSYIDAVLRPPSELSAYPLNDGNKNGLPGVIAGVDEFGLPILQSTVAPNVAAPNSSQIPSTHKTNIL